MASNRDQRQHETHFKVMRLLDENASISTREIADKVGISNGAAYYCVTALVEKGFVKLNNFTQSKRKANYIYELTLHVLIKHSIRFSGEWMVAGNTVTNPFKISEKVIAWWMYRLMQLQNWASKFHGST